MYICFLVFTLNMKILKFIKWYEFVKIILYYNYYNFFINIFHIFVYKCKDYLYFIPVSTIIGTYLVITNYIRLHDVCYGKQTLEKLLC